jgi:alpha-tubulin suppressor-like RCC1 family protein
MRWLDFAETGPFLRTLVVWGYGGDGELGNGEFSDSATLVAVEGVGGTGTLTGVTSVVIYSGGYCALLVSGGVECWGEGKSGQLGNGTFYTSGNEGSATPVTVDGVGGTGTLTGVKSLVEGDCSLLSSGGVDCWGYGYNGQLGNGRFYKIPPAGNASPVEVGAV